MIIFCPEFLNLYASIYGRYKFCFLQIKPLLHMAKTLGVQAGDFYELMTGPTSKILDKWFESDVLKVNFG